MSVLALVPGAIINTWLGRARIQSIRRANGQTYVTFHDGEDAHETTIRDFLPATRPGEVSVSSPRSAILDSLTGEELRRVLMRRKHLLDIVAPTNHDPEFSDLDPRNRYTDQVPYDIRVKRKLEDCATWRRHVNEAKALGAKLDLKAGPHWGRSALYDVINRFNVDAELALTRAGKHLDHAVIKDTDPAVAAEVYSYYVTNVSGPKRNQGVHYNNTLAALGTAGLVPFQDGTPDARSAAERVLSRTRFDALWRVAAKGAPTGQSAKTVQSQSRRPDKVSTRHTAFDFGDLIQMDATPCDFLVRGPNGAFKPHAVLAVDVATRYAWMRLTAGPPQASDYLLLLFDIINPYEWEPVHPDFRHEIVTPKAVAINLSPRSHVVPTAVSLDHGSEGENEQVASLLVRLGVQVLWSRALEPADKAYIESHIRTYALFGQLVPGYKGNSVANSGDEKVDESTLVTWEAAWTMCRFWSHWYNRQRHDGLTVGGPFNPGVMTPLEAVDTSLRSGVPLRVANNPNLIFDFLPTVRATPQPDGVPVNKITYAPRVGYDRTVFDNAIRNGQGRRKLTFHHDPHDPGHIFYNVPGTYEWVVLYAPGATGEAVRPLEDIRTRVLQNFAVQRRSTKKERDAAKGELQRRVVDPIVATDKHREADKPHVKPSDVIVQGVVTQDALAELDDFEWAELG